MFALASRYPRLASVSDIGDSFLKTARDGHNATRRDARAASDDGHDIYALNVTAADGPLPSADRARVLVLSGVHPRELAPPELALRFAERLAAGYGADADVTWLLRRVEVHFVLHANPDGRAATEARPGAARVRKNLNPGGNGDGGGGAAAAACPAGRRPGVDLNRNYDFAWGRPDGSSDRPCDGDYRGTRPHSEPETRAIVDYARRLFPAGQRRDGAVGGVADDAALGEGACAGRRRRRALLPPSRPLTRAARRGTSDIAGIFVDIHSAGECLVLPRPSSRGALGETRCVQGDRSTQADILLVKFTSLTMHMQMPRRVCLTKLACRVPLHLSATRSSSWSELTTI